MSSVVVQANEPKGLCKVEPLVNLVKYTVRISLKDKCKNTAFKLAKNYNKKWNVKDFLWSYETVNGDNPHLHGYVIMEEYAGATMSEWMAKQTEKKEGPSTYWHEKIKNETKMLTYTMKDKNFITNLSDDKIQLLLKKVDEIKENMNKKGYQKVLELVKIKIEKDEMDERKIDLCDIAEMIKNIYEDEWDKPVPFFKLKEYTLYTAKKLNLCQAETKTLLSGMF